MRRGSHRDRWVRDGRAMLGRRCDPKVKALQELGLLGAATRAELARLCRLLNELRFEPGQILPDDVPGSGSSYIVVDGLVQMSIGDQPVWTVSAGNLIGDLGLLGKERKPMVATAITEVRVLEFEPGAQRFLCSLPAVAAWAAAEVAGASRA